jgi:transposase
VHLALTRLYGRAPLGERVLGTVPQHYGQTVTSLGAVGVQGVQAVMTGEGATDAEVFRTYVKRVRGPTLTRGDIVVLDNLSAHNATGVPQALARRQVRRLFWPPSSPDLSPMARCVSKLKTTFDGRWAYTARERPVFRGDRGAPCVPAHG